MPSITVSAKTRRPVVAEHARDHPQYEYFPETGEERFESLMAAPLVVRGTTIGVLVVQTREARHFRTLGDVRDLVGASIDIPDSSFAVASSYFEVRGRLRLGDAMVDERSLVRRQGIDVTTLWRERGAFDRETTQTLPGAQR